jgi:hypothetical protein
MKVIPLQSQILKQSLDSLKISFKASKIAGAVLPLSDFVPGKCLAAYARCVHGTSIEANQQNQLTKPSAKEQK